MKVFHGHSKWSKAANYLRKVAPPQAFDWTLNAPPDQKLFRKLKYKIKIS